MKFSPKTSTLFISHGAPDLLTRDIPAHQFLKDLSKNFEKPKAIIVFSAHYESEIIEVTGNHKLATIHDFGGFSPELHKMEYNAEGAPELASEVVELFKEVGFEAKINPKRGLDHGAWVPLKLMYPLADIPIIQISIQPNESAIYHYKIGMIISEMKQKNILIIGSGSLTHNLNMAFQNSDRPTPVWAKEFSEEILNKLQKQDLNALLNWHELKFAQENHPSPEHLVPLLIALGAAAQDFTAARLHHSFDYSVLAMDCYIFN